MFIVKWSNCADWPWETAAKLRAALARERAYRSQAEIEAFARWLEEMGLGDIFFKPAYIQYAEER